MSSTPLQFQGPLPSHPSSHPGPGCIGSTSVSSDMKKEDTVSVIVMNRIPDAQLKLKVSNLEQENCQWLAKHKPININMALCLFILSSFYLLLISSVTSLQVDLILEYETMEYKNTVMECKFDLEGDTLGTVTWGKDGNSFFQYNRRRVPHKELLVDLVPGVTVDIEKSNATHLFLTNLKQESSGKYYCAVTTSGGGILTKWARENMTTVARHHPLIISTRKGFFLITEKNYSAATTLEGSRPVHSVAYHYTDGTIFYASEFGTIIHQDFHESETDATALPQLGGALILAEEGQVTSMAVDWLRNTLYFTDDSLDTIGKVNLTSERRETLLDSSHGVVNPESIVVDPFQGYLFWGDNDERDKKIVSSALDGKTNKRTIVSSNLKRAILALDLDRRRLFFISNDGLSSCKYDGSATRVDFRHRTLDSNVNSLSYYDEFIFWSRYDSGKSSSGLFYARILSPEVKVEELPIKSILDVKVFHPEMQKNSMKYSCDLLECSDSCNVDTEGSAFCTCPSGYKLTAGATVCSKENADQSCEKSQTIVNSRTACKGELVFEEKFDSNTLDLSKWQNTVRISSDHEMEFVVFDKDNKNIYIKDGNLNIKPTLIDDNIVFMGNISLIGYPNMISPVKLAVVRYTVISGFGHDHDNFIRCTTPVTHLCEKRAMSYNIIPPAKSALINTAHAFNFRYGQVSIRAKLPRGDWIFPVLNLQVTKDFYSPDYRSGVVRVADVRGNQQLICDGMEFGSKNLMSGVAVGPQLNIKKHYIYREADKEWTDDFHIYRLTWTPDELTFSVDDQPSENIVTPGKTLTEVLGLPKQNGSSKIDPFNRDMYLSVGVGVGGALEFPDHCVSGSGQHSLDGAKPWRNTEVKGMLKFWQKKSIWSPTWGEHSALLIDYISVRAL